MKKKQNRWLRSKVSTTINPELFQAFIRGLIPGFQIPNFISKEEAMGIAKKIAQFIEEYKTAPGVGKAGETLVEHSHNFDEYAAHSAVWLSKDGGLPEREYLVKLVCGFIALTTGLPIKPLLNGMRQCFYGVFRKINAGAGAHVDIVSEDSDAFKSRAVKFQGSIVLHLEVPAKGGETVIWDRVAAEGDKMCLLDSWQYAEDMLADDQFVEVPCIAGELVILPTTNYHKVNPSDDLNGSRISFGIFIVIFNNEPDTIYIYN